MSQGVDRDNERSQQLPPTILYFTDSINNTNNSQNMTQQQNRFRQRSAPGRSLRFLLLLLLLLLRLRMHRTSGDSLESISLQERRYEQAVLTVSSRQHPVLVRVNHTIF